MTQMKILPSSLALSILLSTSAAAGSITIGKSSDPDRVDIFKEKEQQIEQIQQQEWQRQQNINQWLRSLPVGCRFNANGLYDCGVGWYQPFSYQGQQYYRQVPRPSQNRN